MNLDNIIQNAKLNWAEPKSNKLSTSSIKKSLLYIQKTLDINKLVKGEYSYQTLLHFCKNSIIRYPTIGSILDLYTNETDIEAKKFIKNVQYNITKIQKIRTIIKTQELPYKNTCSTECISLIYDLINDKEIINIEPYTLFEKLYKLYKPQESYVNLKMIIDYTAYFISLKDVDLANKLRKIYKSYIKETNLTIDIVFSKESLWKGELIEYLRKIHSERLNISSAYPETTLRKIMSRNVLLFRHIEKYLDIHYKNIPSSIDTLQWFFINSTIKDVEKTLIYIGNHFVEPDNDRVKSKHTTHHCKDFIKTSISLFRDKIPHYFKCKNDLQTLKTPEILNKINNLREIPFENVRRHFYDYEIKEIMEEVKNDHKYTLIFTILQEIGLRIGAVVTLKTKHFLNHKGEYLEKSKKMEKGRKYRSFPISENLREKVKLYLEHYNEIKNNQESYLFPSENGKHISTDAVRAKLNRITQKLDIYGQHVHPHAFRHTIVNDLMSKGNKLENVSKFMGHSNISTTEHYYWTTEIENIVPLMNIPWLKNSSKSVYPKNIDENNDKEEQNDLSIDLLVSIIGVYQSVLNFEQKQTIKEKIPNIEEIFANICDYSTTMASTLG